MQTAKNLEGFHIIESIDNSFKNWYFSNSYFGLGIEGKITLPEGKTVTCSAANKSIASYNSFKAKVAMRSNDLIVQFQTVIEDGTKIALELGGSINQSDVSLSSRDAFFINGKMVKIGPVESDYVLLNNDSKAIEYKFKTPNYDTTGNRKLDLTFTSIRRAFFNIKQRSLTCTHDSKCSKIYMSEQQKQQVKEESFADTLTDWKDFFGTINTDFKVSAANGLCKLTHKRTKNFSFGQFSGVLVDENGKDYPINNVDGVISHIFTQC